MSPWASGDALTSTNLNTKTGFGVLYNAKDSTYGAVGDGATDDSLAIQAAIDAASAAGGGTVYLPGGTYLVTFHTHSTSTSVASGIRLKSNVRLQGDGIGSTIIKLSGSATPPAGMGASPQLHIVSTHYAYTATLGNAQSNITVQDLTVDGSAATFSVDLTSYVHMGLFVGATRGAYINRVRVKNVYGTGTGPTGPTRETMHFEANTSADIHYTDCEAVADQASTSTGFSTNTSTNVSYANCTAHGMAVAMGFTHWTCSHVQYTNCRAYDNGYAGFNSEISEFVTYTNCHSGGRAAAYASSAFFSSNENLGNDYGFRVLGSTYVQYNGCVASYNTAGDGYGWYVSSYAGPVNSSWVVLDNCISTANLYGIVVDASQSDVATTNTCKITGNSTAQIGGAGNIDTMPARVTTAPIEVWQAINGTSGVRFNVNGTTGTNQFRFLQDGSTILSVGSAGGANLIGLNQGILVSHRTFASSSITHSDSGGITAGAFFVTIGASGLSLGIESGGSLYWINSTVSAA